MGILVSSDTRVIVQGITGREGSFHTQRMLEYGTQVVGGVTPGKGGQPVTFTLNQGSDQQETREVPVFNTVAEAVEETGADASVIFVPAPFAADAIMEAADAELEVIVAITEGIPIVDTLRAYSKVQQSLSTLIGPNCPGVLTVGQTKLGIMPGHIFRPGPVGVISRSGTLTYEVVDQLSRAGIGQTTCVGIGGDPVIGTSFLELLIEFEEDPETRCVVLIGEIGGSDEEEAAEYCKEMTTPVVAFISGRTAPEGKRMGHAGAIVSGGKGTAESKVKAFQSAGVPVPETIPDLVAEVKRKLTEQGIVV